MQLAVWASSLEPFNVSRLFNRLPRDANLKFLQSKLLSQTFESKASPEKPTFNSRWILGEFKANCFVFQILLVSQLSRPNKTASTWMRPFGWLHCLVNLASIQFIIKVVWKIICFKVVFNCKSFSLAPSWRSEFYSDERTGLKIKRNARGCKLFSVATCENRRICEL